MKFSIPPPLIIVVVACTTYMAQQVSAQNYGIAITNAHSGRRLYAQKNKNWESGVGGAKSGTEFWADQKWNFDETECPTNSAYATDYCFTITNAHSNRRLYAQSGKAWENGVGGGDAAGTLFGDQKWVLQEDDCGVNERCFLIVHAISGRRLYAQAGKNWESGVGGAAADGVVYDDQKWFLDIVLPGELEEPCLSYATLLPTMQGTDCSFDSISTIIQDELNNVQCTTHASVEEEIKALTQELDYMEGIFEITNQCLGLTDNCLTNWEDLYMQGCTYDKIITKLAKKLPNCDAEQELQYWTSSTTKEEMMDKVNDLCGSGWDLISQSAFTDIDERFDDTFMNEYVSGRTFLNEETGSFQDTDVGNAISSFRNDEATSTRLQSVPNLENCSLNSIMCCFGRDRQANDNNGNCNDNRCANADPADNSNLCFLNDEYDNKPFPGESEGDIHCHGLAWGDDENDFTAQLRYNNFFYVSLFDHMYQRGYVESTVAEPDIPMCACIEDMQPVSRADCTEVGAKLAFTVSFEQGMLVANPDDDNLELQFNSCQGTNPSNGANQNNDLASYVHRLKNRGKLSQEMEDYIFEILVGYNQPGNNENEDACTAAYEATTGQLYPEGITITNAHSGRRLFATSGQNGGNGFGASNATEIDDDEKWYLVPSSCDGGAYAIEGQSCFELLNAESGRRAFAQKGKSWEQGAGAANNLYVYPDQKWILEPADGFEDAYFVTNAYSGRRLYAQKNKDGEAGVGAGVGTRWDDQKWLIPDLLDNYDDIL